MSSLLKSQNSELTKVLENGPLGEMANFQKVNLPKNQLTKSQVAKSQVAQKVG
jgi:hypothetical protein